MNPILSSFHALRRGLVALLMLALAGAAAAQTDPPGRVAGLSHMEGSVVFAPGGETERVDAVLNRPVTTGDRLWTDQGGRAEVHLGSAALHLDSQTFLEVVALDHDALLANLNEGTVKARIRQLGGGENFEVITPQLAFRATQPGDYRIDVDPAGGITSVTVHSGAALVQGSGGGTLPVHAGQQFAFTGRNLQRVAGTVSTAKDGFEQWAEARNRAEDQSTSARYVPREVVGYQQLDTHGTWTQEAGHGPVWYPRTTVADWAPYRYGRWDWIAPWGWTWIDDAPWGFAPFHYGRWAQIGSRWAWVPGQIGPRPVYSPALVAFVGGAGVGWFPLAPGEAWRPNYRASAHYLRNANRHMHSHHGGQGFHHQRRAEAITAVRTEDFNRGGRVQRHRDPTHSGDFARSQIVAPPAMPDQRRWGDENRAVMPRVQPRAQMELRPRMDERREQLQRAMPSPPQVVVPSPPQVRMPSPPQVVMPQIVQPRMLPSPRAEERGREDDRGWRSQQREERASRREERQEQRQDQRQEGRREERGFHRSERGSLRDDDGGRGRGRAQRIN